jgi:hypothetical protein
VDGRPAHVKAAAPAMCQDEPSATAGRLRLCLPTSVVWNRGES